MTEYFDFALEFVAPRKPGAIYRRRDAGDGIGAGDGRKRVPLVALAEP
jgi:hypothetical protein